MPTIVGQHVLATGGGRRTVNANRRWQTVVDSEDAMSAQPPAPLPAGLPTSTDVLVVGAGPVGLALAAALTSRGVDVVLVDRQAEGANTSRAAVVHARTLEVLEAVGVTDELVGRGVVVPRFTVRDGDRALLAIDFDGLPTRYPYTLMVPQDVTEEVLAARLRATGGEVRRGHEVVSLVQDGDGVTAATATGETVRARYAVGADGMHSTVRELAGIGFAGAGYAQSFVLADVRLDWGLRPDEVQLFFSPAGLVVVAPLPGGRHRIVATMDDAPERPALADVQALLDERGPRRSPGRVTEVVWSSRFRVHHRLADRYRAGRVLLAGDAAHVHSPAGGQGMNTGLQDAIALAPRLAAVLAGDAPAASLDAYEAERRPVAEGVVRMTDRMTRAATSGGAPARRARNLLLRVLDRVPAVRRRMAMRLSELTAGAPRT
ncbi:FAD-dependent oxidoreductase [Actinomadura syzygii]|uniref:FAD-dependent oxidoreductase n=1 Tax=Actinomadura syzygii TaxID=1427538 RepID=A0A5D0TZX5_9ACTN|nr:FAD-dependent oxidoreductase [Actinomadura syzygii]TYC11030.1 FAD-dependent oxidoreductase [Actinomadura syzygii]